VTVVERTETARGLGIARPRVDADVKVKGRASYGGDYEPARLLHARLVLSPHPHARIVGVDVSAALVMPGVHDVLTAKDLPTAGALGSRTGEPLAAGEVVFAGQPVAVVLAQTEGQAEDGIEHVRIDYEILDPVIDLDTALEPDAPVARHAPIVHLDGPSLGGGPGAVTRDEPNVMDSYLLERGNVEEALVRSEAAVAGTFRTSRLYQGYLEPLVAVAWPEADGGVGVRSSNQSVFFLRGVLASVYGLPLDRVRVDASMVGGGFGAKLGIAESIAVGAALATGRAVRLMMTRSEDFAASNPGPAMTIDLSVGGGTEGLTGIRGRILVDTGANCDWSPAPLAGGKLNGYYRWDDWSVETIGVRTNHVGAGAYRAPSSPQLAFALESLIDELAAELRVDPIELRLASCAEPGDLRLTGALWPVIGNREVLEALRDHALWRNRHELPPDEGVGVAGGMFGGGRMSASAMIRLDEDGRFTLVTGYVDMSGSATSVVALAAEALTVDVTEIRLAAGDSSMAPRSGISGGSMVVYCLGSAVLKAAEDARRQILAIAAQELETQPAELELSDGRVRRRDRPEDEGITLAAIANRSSSLSATHAPVEGHGRHLPEEHAPIAAAALAHVRVDRETGHVQVKKLVAAQDVGRAINPALCEGQIIGAAVQAIGIALYEGIEDDGTGRQANGSFQGYAMPRAGSLPPIETLIVEVPAPSGPHGARGVGEPGIVGPPAAIANAIAAATGVRLRELPMTPSRVWRALQRG
jgi:CO/xanthine dehydrogenase Mo-binding subunit